ncbi:hypothetical protein ONE63_003417 [Megalurothrips usitatus]|uniref:ABCA1-4-like C-terminal R2 regulatory domain-containing protein n=1 Tax=Megalurothrips usitatus TaxID=439358 RepID=A0AAV7XBP3_9NEOP|nr:hypothetical protein ONE63_003417 [Megalurothrips usitatus]
MDPGARRQVWRLVHGVVAAGRSVLLTSHSMDECEVLCQRLTVMANGRMTCLGSPHHLKRKHGAGYTAVVCCQASRTEEVVSYLLERLSGGALVESHLHQLKFHWPPEVSLVRLFLTLDEARVNGSVCDYSVSHTTLEDVFMKFASDQEGVLT